MKTKRASYVYVENDRIAFIYRELRGFEGLRVGKTKRAKS